MKYGVKSEREREREKSRNKLTKTMNVKDSSLHPTRPSTFPDLLYAFLSHI